MPPRRLLNLTLTALLSTVSLVAVAGCAAALEPSGAEPPATTSSESAPPGEDAWVVVIFEDRLEQFDGSLMDALLETEMKADEALAEANAGWIDGNDVGAHGYELYFVGNDVNVMWNALEPVFREAPVAWTRVELRNGLEDPAPEIIVAD